MLHLGDNALILGHRNSEWTGHGPVIEQDIALSNIALDLVGQARNHYQHAATLLNDGSTEDTLAYLRDTRSFRNCLLVEQPNGDWGTTVTRQFFFSVYQYFLYTHLQQSTDQTLSAIAEKSFKEVAYHLRWSSEWMIRLGDGTEESHKRMQESVNTLWAFTGELFTAADYEMQLAADGTAVDPAIFAADAQSKIQEILARATLRAPAEEWMQAGGKTGMHTEHLGYLLAEMQFLQRAYPGAEW